MKFSGFYKFRIKLLRLILFILFTFLMILPSFAATTNSPINAKEHISLYAKSIPIEEKVGRFLIHEFNPDDIEVQATGGGSFMYTQAHGIKIEGVRIESISLSAMMKSDFPGSDIEHKDKYELADMIYMSKGEVVVLQKDVDEYCRQELEDIKGFNNLKIDFRNNGIVFSGIYTAKFIFDFDIRLKATANVIFDKNGLNLTNVKLYINNVQQPESLAKLLTNKINPLIEPEKIPFPISKTKIITQDDRLIATGYPRSLSNNYKCNIWKYSKKNITKNKTDTSE